MMRSKYLTAACSAVLLTAWSAPGWAQQTDSRQQQQRSDQQQTQQQSKQAQDKQRTAHGSQAVIDSAGQPTNVLVVGKVTDARDVTLAGTAGDNHRLLKVMPKGGQEIVVDIGVRSEQNSDLSISKGDRIVAMGKPARINGRPVLFAANVAELQQVNLSNAGQSSAKQGGSSQKANQKDGASMNSQSSAGASSQQASSKQANSNQKGQDEYATVVYLFESDNFAEDQHGLYDSDFAWTTRDPMYDSWNDTATAWENSERGHYDMFGYDDAGEAGWWDW